MDRNGGRKEGREAHVRREGRDGWKRRGGKEEERMEEEKYIWIR